MDVRAWDVPREKVAATPSQYCVEMSSATTPIFCKVSHQALCRRFGKEVGGRHILIVDSVSTTRTRKEQVVTATGEDIGWIIQMIDVNYEVNTALRVLGYRQDCSQKHEVVQKWRKHAWHTQTPIYS